MALKHIQVRFQQQQEDVRYIADLVKEWIEEVLVVRRVFEILQACEPTVQLHLIEPFDGMRTMWYNMCPCLNARQYEGRIEERGEELKGILYRLSEYTLPTGRRDAEWHARHMSARDTLRDTWTKYSEITLEYWKRKGFKKAWLKAIQATLESTAAAGTPSPPARSPEPQATPKKQVISPPMTTKLIPHQHIPQNVSERKVTKRKREALNPPASFQEEIPSPSQSVELLVTKQAALTVTEIPVKETHLEVAASLFSNAQEHVSSVRWTKFLNFMRNAGCELKTSEGSGYTFVSRNVVTGENATVVIHRPHPDATLRAVHLRNNKFRIVEAFGWRKEMFVARK